MTLRSLKSIALFPIPLVTGLFKMCAYNRGIQMTNDYIYELVEGFSDILVCTIQLTVNRHR